MRCVPSGPGRVCDTEIRLDGCDEMLPCGAGVYDACKYDLSDCMNVPRSGTCTIRCRYPYAGPDFNASCPSENILANDGLLWDEDQCVLAECPDPNITEDSSFVWDGSAFVCRAGFVGEPARRCSAIGSPPDCRAEAVFDGCVPTQPCTAPNADPCRYELDECSMLGPGEACVLSCKFPYIGTSNASGHCPANNTELDFPVPVDVHDDGCELTCDDPVIAPPGYEKVGNSWQCAAGYAGRAHVHCVINETEVINETCGSYMNLSGCMQIQPCQPPTYIDKCMYEAVNCEDLPSGGSCAIICRYPFYSPDVYEDGLFCPQDNVDPLKEVEVRQIPTCELFCPSPPPPPGYIKLHDLLLETENGTEINRDPAYTCAPGWTGTPNHTCSVNSTTCAVPATLQGCFQMLPCMPIDPRSFDTCTFNITECEEKSQTNIAEYTGPAPGTICQLSCREPMRGDVTTASCVERNIDPRRRMEYDLPTCNMYCPAPEVIPEGYVHLGATAGNVSNSTIQLPDGANVASIEYRCAPGYAGLAQISCHLQGSYSSATGTVECVTVTSFSGCAPSQPCVAPVVDSCRHDVSACRNLPPGQSCEVSCTPPLVGLPSTFHCPADNVDSTQLVLGELPSCRFPFGCEEPVPLTQGYVKVNESSYECAEGYVGEAEWDCYLARFCAPMLILSGCHELVPCALPAPEDQICGLNYTACTGTGPGQMCRVPCLAGYIENTSYVWEEDEMEMEEQMMTNNISMAGLPDNATEPSCPAGNIDPTKVIEFERIRCEFQVCIDPHPTPLGYTKLPNGTWTCQRGFVGEVVKECHVCNASLALSGCMPVMPCVAPVLPDDQCMLDLSNCTFLNPGDSCEIACQWPFAGSLPSYGVCPSDNTDPTFEFNFTMPHCELTCHSPDPVPEGYVLAESGEWQCAESYSGKAEYHCELMSECWSMASLCGCYAPLACDVPTVEFCTHVEIGCNASLPAGQECNFTCIPPFVGDMEVAHCPHDNQDAAGGLVWSLPRCVMPFCDEPVGEGYQRTTSGWHCAPGYAGTVRSSCESSWDCCEVHLALEGCNPILGCAVPTEYDECVLDFSDCVNISSGESCEVTCREPHVGLPTVAECLDENTEPGRRIDWTPPRCQILSCPPPEPMPLGYDYDNETRTYTCADGYAGRPSVACRAGPSPGCEVLAELSGCLPLAACPLPPMDLQCMMETTCENAMVQPGGSCDISCRTPYIGGTENASCPSGNTDSGTIATMDLPLCELRCEIPAAIPPGYEQTEFGWRCADGFIGGVLARCVIDQETCRTSLLLEGCLRLEPCKPPPNPSPCLYDLFGCDRVQPGSFCRLRCRPPFSGGSPKMICPAGNTNPDYVMKWAEPYCYCPAPEAVPAAYIEDEEPGTFRCAPGYVGRPTLFCGESPQCQQEPALTGCVSPDVCHVEPFIDDDDRPGMVRGVVAFGPAEVEGVIDEEHVDGYDILLADECGQALPLPALATVPRRALPAAGGCCETRSYQVAVEADLMDARLNGRTATVLVAISGLLHGKVINITDVAGQASTTNKVTVTGAARAAHTVPVVSMWLIASAAVQLHRSSV